VYVKDIALGHVRAGGIPGHPDYRRIDYSRLILDAATSDARASYRDAELLRQGADGPGRQHPRHHYIGYRMDSVRRHDHALGYGHRAAGQRAEERARSI